jgi:hypothetical protein
MGAVVRRIFPLLLIASVLSAVGCGGSVATPSSSSTGTTGGSGANVLSIAVDGGPTAGLPNGEIYEDAAFATATVCAPGSTSNCAIITNLLVDTGSTGLRLFAPEVASLNLPALNASNGSPAYDCVSFVSGDYMWGSVEEADVSLGGETAEKAPIQVISTTSVGVPSTCSNGGTTNVNSEALLGANGILGVGSEPTDCFYEGASACSPTFGLASPPYPAYYTCSGSTCSPAFAAVSSQVTNPVALFPTDNNGVVVELPAVSGAAASVTGSLIFGIGTESNNQLPSSATIFTLSCDDFTTDFGGQTYGITNTVDCAGPGSFLDTGSNGLYFPNATGITECSANTPAGNLTGYYCPASTESLSATNQGANGASKNTSFAVANTETLFSSPSTEADAAMSQLAGTNPPGAGFDWGLPFFFGVNVYTSIDSTPMPSGAPAAPWWAY